MSFSLLTAGISAVLGLLSVLLVLPMFTRKRFDPSGKFCYVPGGSMGLGKALAEELVRRGAHVVIAARNTERAAGVIESLRALAGDDKQRQIFAVTADLTSRAASDAALAEACAAFGGAPPDYLFLCAGFSKPQLFLDTSAEDLQAGLDGVYWVSAHTAHAAATMMAKQRKPGTITFVSSFLGYTTLPGYGSYTPGKFALRALADTLRSELSLYDIKVHLYMPAGILSPGYETENKSKHALTKKIEDGDTPIAPEAAVAKLVAGIETGQYQITNDLITELVRCNTKGAAPGNGVLDAIFMPIFRMHVDGIVRSFKPQVEKDLAARGFYDK